MLQVLNMLWNSHDEEIPRVATLLHLQHTFERYKRCHIFSRWTIFNLQRHFSIGEEREGNPSPVMAHDTLHSVSLCDL